MKKVIIGLILAVIIVVALVWYAPTIISYFQNSSSNSSDASYTSLTLRETMNNSASIWFGDTKYDFGYSYGVLGVSTFYGGGKSYTPHKGDTYRDFGIEVKVSDVGSNYISNYIVILVKPTIQNYMASLHYTMVNLTLNEPTWVNITSGLVNETHQYGFRYLGIVWPVSDPQLTIHTDTGEKTYRVTDSGSAIWNSDIKDFNIETRVYKIESAHMIIYVKPLY